MSKIYVGDVGTSISLNTGLDLTGATVTDIYVKKPDGTLVTWTGTVTDDTCITRVTQAGDLDQKGVYYVQAKLSLGGWVGRGETANFTVYDVFK